MTLRIHLHVTNTHNTKGQLVLRNAITVHNVIMNPLAGNLTILYQLFRLRSVKCDMLMGYKQRARTDMVKTTTYWGLKTSYKLHYKTKEQFNSCEQSINN